ncbi:hypothetical protein AFK68_02075 [Hydrocoleum sp. CS-953]|uniref:hypothetical protein n=1 Tax=Hydrocoleum sp. CS-953 TaxID=1671698 RepID=UPI000B9A8709|nr:hypothetical protein [Hydrocoleum sp. CS-953]OZH55829.1 hypothetical protein AFK68_02075 [Hydrocoleum sp. CS-953]
MWFIDLKTAVTSYFGARFGDQTPTIKLTSHFGARFGDQTPTIKLTSHFGAWVWRPNPYSRMLQPNY